LIESLLTIARILAPGAAWKVRGVRERSAEVAPTQQGKPMNLLYVLLFGLVVGAVARLLVPGKDPGGWITSIVLGILGSFVGEYVGRFLGVSGEGRPAGFLMSVVGAVLLLLGYRLLMRRQASA
jgi:uncharacterized membrane protein YeaQ/YmgE (transglycosylase-associated protein family)